MRYINCPEHQYKMLPFFKKVNIHYSEYIAEMTPLFLCPECKVIYARTTKYPANRRITTYEDMPVISTDLPIMDSLAKKSPKPSHSKPIKPQPSVTEAPADAGSKSTQNEMLNALTLIENAYKKPKSPESDVVRLKTLEDNEIAAYLRDDFEKLQKDYPGLAPEGLTIQTLISKAFPTKIKQTCVVRNSSVTGDNGVLLRRVDIYNLSSSYVNTRLDPEQRLLFSGKLVRSDLVITGVKVIDNPVFKSSDIKKGLTFYYDTDTRDKTNWLYSVTETPSEEPKNRSDEIVAWGEYLDWKRQLAELRVHGLKYIGFKVDPYNQEMMFLVVSEGEDGLDDLKKALRRNDVSAFSNAYSTNNYRFTFNNEDRSYQNTDTGIALSYLGQGNQYLLNDIYMPEWDLFRRSAKRYKNKSPEQGSANETIDELLTAISKEYQHPIFTELIFELSPNGMATIERQYRQFGFLAEDIEDTIASEFYADGFIATSQIGDFALIRRLRKGINDFIAGRAVSQGLEEWLFDITKARSISELPDIDVWQNQNINENQKNAVRKILAAPDVCLVQGPPGTGKTTVIAEAIYQSVLKHKRVLVASQANLAVDNALERLIADPKIRAIRLGSAKKINTSVENITEENVLKSFYESLVSFVDQKYIQRWHIHDNEITALEDDYEVISKNLHFYEVCNKNVSQLQHDYDTLNQSPAIQSQRSKLNAITNWIESLQKIQLYCNGTESNLIIPESSKFIQNIWERIKPFVSTATIKGVILNTSKSDLTQLINSDQIKDATAVLRGIIARTVLATRLYAKLTDPLVEYSTTDELEILKDRKQALEEQMVTSPNPAVIQEWQTVYKQISEYALTSLGITEEDKSLFGSALKLKGPGEKASKYMRNCLESIKSEADSIINNVVHYSEQLIDPLTQRESLIKKELGKEESRLKDILDKIDKETSVLESIKSNLRSYESSYGTEKNELLDVIDDRIEGLKEDASRGVTKEDWEDIFTGFKEWVANIPDYTSEKELYLRRFINGCNVVGVSCTENARTLTEAGFDDFDVVIIDEVSKATPPELLIPMLRGKKIVLVGDHRQLPPLFNEHEKTYQEAAEQQSEMEEVSVELTMDDFNRFRDMVTSSLFQRYFEGADNSIKATLTCQYRMHKDIMDIVNMFYDGYLEDGNKDNYSSGVKAHGLTIDSTSGTEMIVPNKHAYWIDSSQLRGIPVFEQRASGSTSAENIIEAKAIIELLKQMELQYANDDRERKVDVGVISFYYDQVALIRRLLQKESFHSINIEVNTVDRFQGKEKEIIIVSLVRNVRRSAHSTESHIAAFQRINVAFSRAQNLLIILGATNMYAEQPVVINDMNTGSPKTVYVYKDIIEMLNQRGAYFSADEVIPDSMANDILTQHGAVRR